VNRVLLILGAVLVFGFVNWQISAKERLRTSGELILLELAPVDPRSLMQGDYMALNFAVARQLPTEKDGVAVLSLDERRVAHFVRADHGQAPAPGEVRLKYRIRQGSPWIGTNGFFFHEGDAQRYASAKFGVFRVNAAGEAMLVDLR